MIPYQFAAARVFNTPLMIHPGKGRVIAEAFARRLEVELIEFSPQMYDEHEFSEPAERRPYEIADGVALIDVCGTLVHKGGWMDAMSGMRGYDAIRCEFDQALSDPKARSIAFLIGSPGGEVSGCFDLIDHIYRCRGEKPLMAILDDMAYSAGYALASACEQITVPRTGGTGSVGVIAMHADMSKRLSAEGIKVTIFQYGDRKADGSEVMPLSDAAAERFQADIDTLGELFVDTVARNRGMAASKVRSTQASTYLGAAGVDIGFADAVMAPDEAFQSLVALTA